jgi:hypothetical protein
MAAARRWNVHEQMESPFRAADLAAIEKGLRDPMAFQALTSCVQKLTDIVNEAKKRKLFGFKCHLGRYPAFPMQMCFGDNDGNRYKVSLSLRGAFEKTGRFFDMETALAVEGAVTFLILSVDGIAALRHIPRHRTPRPRF